MKKIVVGTREQLKIHTVNKVSKGLLPFKQGLFILQVSERTLRRWIRKYEREGISFLRHGNKGKSPANKHPDAFKKQIMNFVERELFDFNMLHALEKIETHFNLKIPRETYRRWCKEYGMVKQAHHKRRGKPRYKRPRYSQKGFMLQLDGSPHRWFNEQETCLVAVIDDASSEVVGGTFFPTESTEACFRVLSTVIAKYGVPSVLYVDRAGLYGGSKRTNFSQVTRALEELSIQVIYANSPEGKGRIERLFRTLQDRLIPEMRMANIKTISEADEYLNNIYLPHLHNPKFSIQPENLTPAWKMLPLNINLKDVFCIKEKRRVARDHTFSFQGEKYLITSSLKYSIYNHDIEIRIDSKSSMKAIFAGQELNVKKIIQGPKRIAA